MRALVRLDRHEREGLNVLLYGRVVVLKVRCASPEAAWRVREQVITDVLDVGRFSIAVGVGRRR